MESAVILAGGKSSRMGRDKALLEFGDETLIERLYRTLRGVFEEILISANDPKTYEFVGAPIVCDVYEKEGSLAGIHAGLLHAASDKCFFVACDMPFVNTELVRYLARFADDYDVVIPMSRNGLEPLHAFYSRTCVPHIEEQLGRGNPKIIDFFPHVRVRRISVEEMSEIDPEELSYFNINTREKYELAKVKLRAQEAS